MNKQIFKCMQCSYFPVQLQIEKYFLNADTFKCPVCEQMNLFDKTKFTILHTFYHLSQSEQKSKPQINYHSQRKNQIGQWTKNQEKGKQKLITIFVQLSDHLYDGLYLNPINPQLKNGFNIDKIQIFDIKTHPFFDTNDQVLRQFAFTSNQKPQKLINFKYKARRVTKIQHLWYCIDVYIKKICQIIFEEDLEQNVQILIASIQQKNLGAKQNADNGSKQLQKQKNEKIFPFDIIHSFKFSYSSYHQLIKNKKQSDQNHVQSQFVKSSKTNEELKLFQRQMKMFIQLFYTFNSDKNLQSDQQKLLSDIINLDLKIVALFTNSFSEQWNKELVRFIEQISKHNKFIIPNNLLLNSFYFESEVQRDTKSQQIASEQVRILKVSQHSVYHSLLYVPHSRSKLSSRQMIERTIQNASKKLLKNEAKRNNEVILGNNNKDAFNKVNCKIDQKQPTTHIQSGSHVDSSESQSKVLVFWRECKKDKAETQEQNSLIKLNKLNIKSYIQLFQQPLQLFNSNNIQGFQQLMSQTVKPQTTKIISKYESNKNPNSNLHSIAIDRVFCSIKGSLLYYVFDYETIVSENYEQLDFLGESTLPQDFRNYAKTYEKSEIKNKNPFKKTNNAVYLVKQPQNVSYTYAQDDSDSVQSL